MKTLEAVLAAGAICFPAAMFAQGSLTPPGAPAPTMKTLAQVEPRTPISSVPYTVTNAGAYYLTTNLSASGAVSGILINTNNVTVDLCGFAMRGVASSGTGITVNDNVSNVTLVNGTISGWQYGVFSGFPTKNIHLRDIQASGNSQVGIYLGNSGFLESCTALTNGPVGGISVGGADSIIRNCIASANAGDGISVRGAGRVEGCVAAENSGVGLRLSGNMIVAQHCNLYGNASDGVYTADDDTVRDCVSGGNKGHGIRASFGCLVAGCSVMGNTSNGIVAGARSEVRDNICYGNGTLTGSAGIFISTNAFNFGGVRVEANHVATGGRGIEVQSTANFIVRNTASANGINYVIRSNNAVGVIIQPPNSATISGSTGGAGVGTTDPWANFSF